MVQKRFSRIIKDIEYICRYREVNDNNLNALQDERLYFSTPSNFNDPYDNLIYANTFQIVNEIIGNIVNGMDSYLEKQRILDKWETQYMRFLWGEERRDTTLLKHSELIVSCIDEIRTAIKNNTKIICFSKKYDSMLMWSHYANNHKGFCLVYAKKNIEEATCFDRFNEVTSVRTKLLPVEYVDKQVDMTKEILQFIRYNKLENMGDIPYVNAEISASKLRRVLTEKSNDWSYEEEWRLIPRIPSIEKESPLCYVKCKPKALILGSQCVLDDRTKITAICEKIGVPVYGIFLSESSPDFKLFVNEDGNTDIA